MPAQTSPFRPRASDLHLGLWVVGLLVLSFGIAGLYGTAVDYDAGPRDEVLPSVAVLVGGGIVLLAAAVALGQLVRDVNARRR